METVDRVAMVVTPKRRYLEWIRRLNDVPRVTEEQLPSMATVFLVQAVDEELSLQDAIDENADDLFEEMLRQWTADEALWPPNRTPHVFRDWFDVRMIDFVVDLAANGPWLADDVDDDALQTWCAWCGSPFEEDDEIVSLGATVASRTMLEELDGEVVPFPVGDRTVDAVVVEEDSPAKREGRDLVFILCSERCATELREALDRTRTAILS